MKKRIVGLKKKKPAGHSGSCLSTQLLGRQTEEDLSSETSPGQGKKKLARVYLSKQVSKLGMVTYVLAQL
jgi:hypothetical protein